jgi:hypothetical protein
MDEAGLFLGFRSFCRFQNPSPSHGYFTRQKPTQKRLSRRRNKMCDYSLHTYPNRLATDGEDLVIHRFGAGSLGLASPADLAPVISASTTAHGGLWYRAKAWFLGRNPKWEAEKRVPAVCIPPGARLILRDIPKSLQRELGVGEVEEVAFIEITAEANTYRDAVRFSNCRQALLQQMREGQRVKVLSTAAGEHEPAELILASSSG